MYRCSFFLGKTDLAKRNIEKTENKKRQVASARKTAFDFCVKYMFLASKRLATLVSYEEMYDLLITTCGRRWSLHDIFVVPSL